MLWQFGLNVKGLEQIDALRNKIPPGFEWLNSDQIAKVDRTLIEEPGGYEFWQRPSLGFAQIPTPKLSVSDSSFGLNLLTLGVYTFSSSRLRQIFDIGGCDVKYRPVDTSQSVPEVQALGYTAFDVIPFGNPFDPERMLGEMRPVRQLDGSFKNEWVMDWANRMAKSPEVYFRDDFVPPAPLFRATGSLWIFATDDLAERVMRAGIDDVLFQDITGPILPRRDRNRELR